MKAESELKEIPVGVKWEWDDNKKCLSYKSNITVNDKNEKKKKTKDGKIDFRSGQPRLVTQANKISKPDSSTSTKSQEAKKQISSDGNVTITDIKNAAISVLSERYYIPSNFIKYTKDPKSSQILEEFLLCLSNYFHWYFENIDSKLVLTELCIERSEAEKKRTETAEYMLQLTLKVLARRYCLLILGLNAVEYHHMNCGGKRVSSGFKDRGLFETFYPFCIFFIWIIFKRRDYELVKSEVGRILRSHSFNSTIKVENILEEDKKIEVVKDISKHKNKILTSYEENKALLDEFKFLANNKTSTKTLSNRSPVLQSVLPTTVQNSNWLFNRRGENLKEFQQQNEIRKIESEKEEEEIDLIKEIGIIGQPMKMFHVKTLMARGNNDEDSNLDTKEVKDENLSVDGNDDNES